jgi:iron complex transport system substrate-binding protein
VLAGGASWGRRSRPFSGPASAQSRVVVDGAGRRVEMPGQVRRVFAAGGPASIFVYTLAPDALLGLDA